MTQYFFTPPNLSYGPAGDDVLFYRFRLEHGLTVLKKDGVYSEVQFPHIDELTAADVFYQGGHVYPVSEVEAAALTAAGYSANITSE